MFLESFNNLYLSDRLERKWLIEEDDAREEEAEKKILLVNVQNQDKWENLLQEQTCVWRRVIPRNQSICPFVKLAPGRFCPSEPISPDNPWG